MRRNMEGKETGAKVIGGIAIGGAVIAIISLIGTCALLLYGLWSCSAPDKGNAPYTKGYIEKWLEECYRTDFTFVREEETVDERDATYVFTDSDGIETYVYQDDYYHLFDHNITVKDTYVPAKLFADKKVKSILSSSDLEYDKWGADNSAEQTGLVFYITSYDDIPYAAELVHSLAETGRVKVYSGSEYNYTDGVPFSHISPVLDIRLETDSNGYFIVSYKVPLDIDGEHNDIRSLDELTANALERYKQLEDSGYIGSKNMSVSEDMPEYYDVMTSAGERLYDMHFTLDSETGGYVMIEPSCFPNTPAIQEPVQKKCQLLERLAGLSDMEVVYAGEFDLRILSASCTEEEPYVRFYRMEYEHGKFSDPLLEVDGLPYIFGEGGGVFGRSELRLSVTDIHAIFGIDVDFDSENGTAKLILPGDEYDIEDSAESLDE